MISPLYAKSILLRRHRQPVFRGKGNINQTVIAILLVFFALYIILLRK